MLTRLGQTIEWPHSIKIPTFPSRAAKTDFWNGFPARYVKQTWLEHCTGSNILHGCIKPKPNASTFYTFEQCWELSFRCRSGLGATSLSLTHMPCLRLCRSQSLFWFDEASLMFPLATSNHHTFSDQLFLMGAAMSRRIAGKGWVWFPKSCQEPATLAQMHSHRT